MAFLSLYYLQNRASEFDDFAQMLEIVALSDLASVMFARKFPFAPQGVSPPPKLPLFGSLDVFRLRKEPINPLLCVRVCVRVLQS